jgi:hypothetical protein
MSGSAVFQLGKQESEISNIGKLRLKALQCISAADYIQQPLSCRHDGASGIGATVEQVIASAESG